MRENIQKLTLPTVKNYTVIDNIFIGAVKNLSLPAYRLFALLASQIKKSDEEFIQYEIRADDLIKILSVTNTKYIYEVLKDATSELHEMRVIIDNDEIRTQYPWLTKSSYLKNEGTAILQFHEDLKPFLLRLTTRYTKVWLSQTFNFTSHNTRNLYLFLCERRNMKAFKIKFENLKLNLKLQPNSYTRYMDFKRRILEPSYKEIHTKTLLQFSYEPMKSGRKITEIYFAVSVLDPKESNREHPKIPKLEEASAMTKLKEKYFLEQENYGLHLVKDARDEDIEDFKCEHGKSWEFAFEDGKPKKIMFKSFLLSKYPFMNFENWASDNIKPKKEKIIIDAEIIEG